jgi:hypothetical protein
VWHYETQVCCSSIPITLIGYFGMCNLPTIFVVILCVMVFLQILMVMRKRQMGGIKVGGIHMLKIGKWVWKMMLV